MILCLGRMGKKHVSRTLSLRKSAELEPLQNTDSLDTLHR